MKRDFIKIIYLLVAIAAIISCEKGNSGKEEIGFGEVRPGQTSEKTLTLNFNTEATKDSSAFVEFVFESENGERPENIEFTIDGTVVIGNSLKFFAKANAGKHDVKIGIRFPKGSPQKRYSGIFVIKNASEALSKGITYTSKKLPVQVGESVAAWSAKYNDPIPFWKVIVFVALIVLILVSAVIYVLTRNNRLFGSKTFKSGMITFPNCDAKVTNVRLDNLVKYDLSFAFDGLEEGLILEPFDKIHSGRKKRFARIKNTSKTLNLNIIHDDIEEIAGTAQELYHLDEIKIIMAENKNFLFRYSNNKNIRKI